MKRLFIWCIHVFCFFNVKAGDIELGKVNWLRDLKEAQIASYKLTKPILILFQEVPGCSTCKNYGSKVLSHPLLVEAIETYFIPLCIHNNKGGSDREVLDFFTEPSWNNPVVQIVNTDLKPIVSRLDGNYTDFGLVTKINASLIKLGILIPEYLRLLEEEFKANQSGLEHASIGMYCFWTGERTYGIAKGVVSTNAGYINGSEVVDIYYNPNETNLDEIIRTGKINHVADKLFSQNPLNINANIPIVKAGSFRLDPETKYYLFQSDYKYVPMTPLQATRANCLIAEGKSCESILSPRQVLWHQKIMKFPKSKLKNQIGRDIMLSWYET